MALIWGHQTSMAQTYHIEYYQLKKIRKNNVTSSVSSGYGIYTTRVKQICYDSYSDGSMNHMSDLKYNKQSNGMQYYSGKCYLDKFCYYVFNDSKGVLNISLSNGDVYVYHKATPPSNKKNGTYYGGCEGGESVDGGNGGYQPNTTTTTGSIGNNRTNNSQSTQNQPQRCPQCGGSGKCNNYSSSIGHRGHCNGNGRCETCGGDGLSGLMDKTRCSVCNGTGRCSRCGGTGVCRKCGGSGKR